MSFLPDPHQIWYQYSRIVIFNANVLDFRYVFALSNYLLISITWSLFSLLAALVRHLSSPSLVHTHLPLSKSQIALSVMHHPVFGIIFLPHSVNLVLHLSPPLHHPSFPLCSIPDLNLTCSTNPPHHRSSPIPTGLQPDYLRGLRTTLRYVLVLPLSYFSWRVCRTKLAVFDHMLIQELSYRKQIARQLHKY